MNWARRTSRATSSQMTGMPVRIRISSFVRGKIEPSLKIYGLEGAGQQHEPETIIRGHLTKR